MPDAAFGHFNEVRVKDEASGQWKRKWQCKHCELLGEKKFFSIGTSASSRMMHVKDKHDNAPPPPRSSSASSSLSSVTEERCGEASQTVLS
jgi:hypothetical protein